MGWRLNERRGFLTQAQAALKWSRVSSAAVPTGV